MCLLQLCVLAATVPFTAYVLVHLHSVLSCVCRFKVLTFDPKKIGVSKITKPETYIHITAEKEVKYYEVGCVPSLHCACVYTAYLPPALHIPMCAYLACTAPVCILHTYPYPVARTLIPMCALHIPSRCVYCMHCAGAHGCGTQASEEAH